MELLDTKGYIPNNMADKLTKKQREVFNRARADKSKCDNCGKIFDDGDLQEIRDFWSRASPGYMMPSGECPDAKCQSFCYPLNEHTAAVFVAEEAVAALRALVACPDYKDIRTKEMRAAREVLAKA